MKFYFDFGLISLKLKGEIHYHFKMTFYKMIMKNDSVNIKKMSLFNDHWKKKVAHEPFIV